MATIATSIQLYDKLSAPINNMLGALTKLTTAFSSVDESMNGAFDSRLIAQANSQVQQANAQMVALGQEIDNNKRKQKGFTDEVEHSSSAMDGLTRKIMGAVGAYASFQGIQKIVNLSDEYTRTTARLGMIADAQNDVETLQNKIYASAQRSRSSYAETADFVAKVSQRTGKMFSNDQAIQFAENLGKVYKIAGANQQDIASSQLQLLQAMGSGVLRGEEFNAVYEATPQVMDLIAEKMGIQTTQLRKMAEQGKITADIVANAILGATGDIEKDFDKIPMTWTDVWTTTMNKLYKMSQPLLQFINVLANHWSIIEPIVVSLATAVGLYTTALLINKGVQAASTIATTVSTIAKLAHSKVTMAEAMATTGLTQAQLAFNAALWACPLTWVVVVIIAIIAVVYAVVAAINKWKDTTISATGVIVGALMAAVAFIWNLFLGLLDIVLAVVNWMWNRWAAFANFFANLFNDPIGSIIRLFGDMADNILGILESIANAMDKLFGSNLAGAVQGWRSGLNSLVESAANKYGNGSYEKIVEELNLSSESLGLNRWAYGDAYNKGYGWGTSIEDKISGAFDTSKVAEDVAATAENTDKAAKALEVTSEDLKYLRDIAARDTVNRFTTAEIKVDMNNNNTISNDMDLDGIVNHLAIGVTAAMEKVAEGVYA